MKSQVKIINGNPTLLVDDKPIPAIAYTTYFQERNCYEEFVNAGYRIFFINVSFTKKPFNSNKTGFTSFRIGAFEDPSSPDYSELEDYVYEILRICPDAMIVPRIYVSMPSWWDDAHPDETVFTQKGGYKEMLFSDVFRRDGAEMLARIVKHIRSSDYARSIMGWQICGGQTQEWFHPDEFGCFCPNAEKYYREWMKKTYGVENAVLPAREEFFGDGETLCKSENAKRYYEFCNKSVAESIDYFAKRLKEETNYEQIVGTFYGYCMNTTNPLRGMYGLYDLLDSPHIDYLCAPSAYSRNRKLGIDWKDQFPTEAIKLHKKLPFIECDIRTYLTENMQSARPGEYPEDIYPMQISNTDSVWAGPPTPELSREALRKSLCHQITRGSAIWWFDMWGGWYSDPFLMDDLAMMKDLYSEDCPFTQTAIGAEVVFFADERAYENYTFGAPLATSIVASHIRMGSTGAPYDTHMVEDAAEVLPLYKAAIFGSPFPSKAGRKALELCREMGIPCLVASLEHPDFKTDEIRAFLKEAGVHVYIENNDVIYAGNGYLGIHAATAGKKTITLPSECSISPIFGSEICEDQASSITLDLEKYKTALFKISPKK